MIQRDQIPAIELPTETVHVEALRGDVQVRGFDLPGLMQYLAALRAASVPKDGETQAQADERASVAVVPVALQGTVLAGDGQPVYSAAQWAQFGARHPGQAFGLYQVVMRLSGQGDGAEKKT